ncbi:electron transport complex subunit RsxC [Criibacterium bergeronii]|uniref:Ion-translocating oxidoreductase complex subunit C n=1 Tax=Criibacterium bergeronii TaxID=1871336 RepID=A0A371IMR9_9FIRM|nr:electron transport complex subunit RsxC [Criibacterium bergeronii]MBS6063918.1 electron transport complex subunit RsxC [Peptostreptococcaceae bacterium]RDY21792.1 electron transport complex subunit RsxC [Criibacterium bergeronii]TRW24552.1 electron transport complex subunit RsxC [Criibacterium bergeronii]
MQLTTFKGGIHPKHNKEKTENLQVVTIDAPATVYIPLIQNIGAPCKSLVAKGDFVKVGQRIGEPLGFVSAPIHSSVSGKVIDVKEMVVNTGNRAVCVVIENDGNYEVDPSIKPYGTVDELSAEKLLEVVKEIGLVGMGGATFPTHVKLKIPEGKTVDTAILNGAECEPYLTCDHRLMLEETQDVVDGLRAILKILGIQNGYIGIEDNKPECISKMTDAVKKYPNIKVITLKTKYPQGAEKQLINVCTGKEVPSGGLPADAGVVVDNVATAAQIAKSLRTGMPLIDRVCTVTGGGVNNPGNFRFRIGTLYSDIVEMTGGFKDDLAKVISGGPMMGVALARTDVPANKGTSGILCFTSEEAKIGETQNCMRCAKCVSVCPVSLEPLYISAYSLRENFEKAEEYHAIDCIECGSCSFICPSKRPLLQSIRVAKAQIQAARRREQAKQQAAQAK